MKEKISAINNVEKFENPDNDIKYDIGDKGNIGNIGVIPVRSGNKDDIISFTIKRIESVINDDIIKDNNTYLELNMKFAFQDIMRAIRKYLGKEGEEEIDDKDRIGDSTETN